MWNFVNTHKSLFEEKFNKCYECFNFYVNGCFQIFSFVNKNNNNKKRRNCITKAILISRENNFIFINNKTLHNENFNTLFRCYINIKKWEGNENKQTI